jgi:hypothetical protein
LVVLQRRQQENGENPESETFSVTGVIRKKALFSKRPVLITDS